MHPDEAAARQYVDKVLNAPTNVPGPKPQPYRPAELRAAILRTAKPAYNNCPKGLRAWIRYLPEDPLGYQKDEWIAAPSKIS